MKFRLLAMVVPLAILMSPAIAEEKVSNDNAWQFAETEADIALREKLEKKLKEVKADKDTYEIYMEDGMYQVSLCKHCHGVDGKSVKESVKGSGNTQVPIPNLAGQNPIYLVDQFQRFGDGRRKDFFMGALSRKATDEEKIHMAIYYAEQKIQPTVEGTPEQRAKGAELYKQFCAECHGEDAKSTKGYAQLAGQKASYTIKIIEDFKNDEGKRMNPFMRAMAFNLKTREEIEAVAYYLSSLK